MTSLLTNDRAYGVMFKFLAQFWENNKHSFDDELPLMLSSMNRHLWREGVYLRPDGMSADPAYDHDWLRLTNSKPELTSDETYAAMVALLEEYRAIGEMPTKDITRLLEELAANPTKHKANWDAVVQDVISWERWGRPS